ncbi:hypothetical protein GGR16_001707 [Chelatococcus caeni]|uniref:Uncharacterized protein n=1 Tax=Chelatococcus caeni TaxID=1348468 RepID=A0A840BTD3_9HYPH|nr:hypothetical protein [Chelatococcus caeni]MBB4016701.1 hypothetical protein [Chelatococcus caeni]
MSNAEERTKRLLERRVAALEKGVQYAFWRHRIADAVVTLVERDGDVSLDALMAELAAAAERSEPVVVDGVQLDPAGKSLAAAIEHLREAIAVHKGE